jgi:hypothetical protein
MSIQLTRFISRINNPRRPYMPVNNIPGPMEHLAAFAIAFVAGIVTAVAVKAYVAWENEFS